MDIIRFAIQNPVKIAVGVILSCLFGLLCLFQIPVQLVPNVDEPRITVTTLWEGASAQEIEREIVERQEEHLKSVANLRQMKSQSVEGMGTVILEFTVGVDKDVALRDVSDKLRQVTNYPAESEEPTVVAADAALDSPIAWLILDAAGQDVSTLHDFVDKQVKPILERAPGIASVDIYGGREREVQIRIDAAKLAARGISFRELEATLRRENDDVSAGTIAQGKRDYTYRTIGKYEQLEQVADTVIGYEAGGPVYVRDVASVVHSYKKARSFVRSQGQPVLALPARRETGANVIQAMDALKKQIEKVNKEVLGPRAMSLALTQVYDETTYIHAAIDLVLHDLVWGGALTIIVLLIFLRSISATGIVAISIPISIISTFLAVALLGRNLNVVMFAGLSFAVGMIVDDAIVVLENIFRHRQMGKPRFDAALEGAREVWGAVLSSTLTTIAVFLPVVFVEQEAGQLFRDIAIAISVSIFMSMLVSVFVIPPLAARFLRGNLPGFEAEPALHPFDRQAGRATTAGRVARLGGLINAAITGLVDRINRSTASRIAVILGLTAASLFGSWALCPPTDYLPAGNRNLVFGFLITPPGLSLDELRRMGETIEAGVRPLWEAKAGDAATWPSVTIPVGLDKDVRNFDVVPPPIDDFFYVAFNGGCFMGGTSREEEVVKPLKFVLENAGAKLPDCFPVMFQASLFGGDSGGNSVEIQVRGETLDEVVAAADVLSGACHEKKVGFPSPDPINYNRGLSQIRVVPDREKAAELRLSVRDIGFILQACVDGAYVGGFREHGDEIDMAILVEGAEGATREQLAAVPIRAGGSAVVTLGSAVAFTHDSAPQQINHIEEMPAVSLTIRPPEGRALANVMATLESEVIAPLRADGRIPPSVITALAGNADKLVQTQTALFGEWKRPLSVLTSRGFLALLVTYLLMAALFESFAYPLVIMFSVPLATVGGFLGLRIVHMLSLYNPVAPVQQLDVLTMLGFVILIGVVVRNAILIVHQALNNMRDYGMPPQQAITESVRTRIRPIFMTALTSVFGMLPLVVAPGSGSELYRGLGAVMVGGLIVATIFTLVLVPALMSLFVSARDALFSLARGTATPAAAPAGTPAVAMRSRAPEFSASGASANAAMQHSPE